MAALGALLGAVAPAAGLAGGVAPWFFLSAYALLGCAIVARAALKESASCTGLKALVLGAFRGAVYGCSFVAAAEITDSVLRTWFHVVPEAEVPPDETAWEGFIMSLIAYAEYGAVLGAGIGLVAWAFGRPAGTGSRPLGKSSE
jgi:hypothetical protein